MSSDRTLRLVNGRLVQSSLFGFWQIGNDPPIPNLPLETSGPAAIQADLALTDEDDQLSAEAVALVAADLAATDAADVVSAAGAVACVADLALADEDDTLSSAGTVGDAVEDEPVSLGGRDKWVSWRDDWIDLPPVVATARMRDEDDTGQITTSAWWPLRSISARMVDDDDGGMATAVAHLYRRPGGLVRYTPKAELRRTAR